MLKNKTDKINLKNNYSRVKNLKEINEYKFNVNI